MRPASTLFTEHADARTARFSTEVTRGLAGTRKELPCKYFYDERGSQLFERITHLDEYYLTRAELSIMHRHAADMAAALGPACLLIEPGAGSALKTRLLLAHLSDPAGYIPIEIASEHLAATVRELSRSFPHLEIQPVHSDFMYGFQLPASRTQPSKKAAYFPGSTIGNFDPACAAAFLRRLAALCGDDGAVIVGVDLKKDVRILEQAYNDRAGLTAQFNLNLLARLNRELGADFQLSRFAHHAFYNPEHGRVEMHLVSMAQQKVHIGGSTIRFAVGETIHTENCYKYSLDEFRALAAGAALDVSRVWTDPHGLFSVQYLTPQA